MPWHPCSNPSIHLTGHLGADGAAHQRHRLVRDPVEHLCSLSALGNHPARREVTRLRIKLDPDTGEVLELQLTEAGGDLVTVTLSGHQRPG